nr:MAG TPA: hypothetical protein [Caudoviricetes sp.]
MISAGFDQPGSFLFRKNLPGNAPHIFLRFEPYHTKVTLINDKITVSSPMADIDHTGTPSDIGGNFQILHFSHMLNF